MFKKIFSVLFAMMFLLTLCSCTRDYSKQTKEFIESFEPDLTNYFIEFSESSCNVTPNKITANAESFATEELKNDSPSFETYLNDEYFYFVIGFTKEDGSYSDEEINEMIKYAISNNLTVDFYFNNDDYTIYKIRKDSVTVDVVTGKDGGLYHEEREYIIQ